MPINPRTALLPLLLAACGGAGDTGARSPEEALDRLLGRFGDFDVESALFFETEPSDYNDSTRGSGGLYLLDADFTCDELGYALQNGMGWYELDGVEGVYLSLSYELPADYPATEPWAALFTPYAVVPGTTPHDDVVLATYRAGAVWFDGSGVFVSDSLGLYVQVADVSSTRMTGALSHHFGDWPFEAERCGYVETYAPF